VQINRFTSQTWQHQRFYCRHQLCLQIRCSLDVRETQLILLCSIKSLSVDTTNSCEMLQEVCHTSEQYQVCQSVTSRYFIRCSQKR